MSTWYYVIKIAITTVPVVGISELSKRSTLMGALLASVPLVSLLAMIWLYVDTRDAAQVAALSRSVSWLVLPSLVLFLLLPVLLERGCAFYVSLAASIGAMIGAYHAVVAIARHFWASSPSSPNGTPDTAPLSHIDTAPRRGARRVDRRPRKSTRS